MATTMDKARMVAWQMEQDGVTYEQAAKVLSEMADRVGHAPENDTLMDNFLTLTEAARELQWMEGTAMEYEQQQQQPAKVFTVVYAVHGERRGVARMQRIEALSERAASIIKGDLEGDGFDHVIDIAEAGTQSGVAAVYYRPDPAKFVTRQEHARRMDTIWSFLTEDSRQGYETGMTAEDMAVRWPE